jgi:branched-chain amino acid transport system substrate-binding protein
MKKTIAVAALFALLATAVFAQGAIKIGATWPLADVTGDHGSKAAIMAVEEINKAGGVLGRQLQLIIVDDELKADKGVAALEKLVTVDNVDFLMGGMASGVALGQIPTMKKYGKIVISTGAASSLVEKSLGADADWYFHLHPWDYNQAGSYQAGWAALQAKYPKMKITRMFLAYEEGAFGKASFDQSKVLFGKDYQFDGASFKSAAMGGGDYTSMLEAAKAYKPDIFLWAGYDADALPMLESAKAMKFSPSLFVGAPPGWPKDFGKSALANNVALYGMWAPSINDISKVSDKFYNSFVAKYKYEPATYFAPLSYSAVYILAEAIQKAGTTETAAVIKALEQTKYASALGETISFTPSNIIKHQGVRNQKILQWQNGRQEVIWPFEAKTAEPVYPFPVWK